MGSKTEEVEILNSKKCSIGMNSFHKKREMKVLHVSNPSDIGHPRMQLMSYFDVFPSSKGSSTVLELENG